MIIVILIIAVVIAIAGGIIYYRSYDYEDLGFGILAIGCVGCLISIVVSINLCVEISMLSVIDKKIAMYEEENTKIETQLAEIVTQYQEYEKGIFTEVTPENATALVALYPELKSDTLVKAQIEAHVSNNEKIKELKETKISGSIMKWWLYFGGNE